MSVARSAVDVIFLTQDHGTQGGMESLVQSSCTLDLAPNQFINNSQLNEYCVSCCIVHNLCISGTIIEFCFADLLQLALEMLNLKKLKH